MANRVTQVVRQTVTDGAQKGRVSQVVRQTIHDAEPPGRASQVFRQVIMENIPNPVAPPSLAYARITG